MNTETFYTMSDADGLLLEVMTMEPEAGATLKGVIQIVHGKCEHKERYQTFMKYMNSVGYACIIHDMRGHGNSVRNNEDLGYMYGVGAEGVLSDIHQITRIAARRWPDLPLILFGHGFGATAACCTARKWEEDISCLILCGAPSRNPAAAPGLLITKLRGRRTKKPAYGKLLNQLMQAPYDKRFPGEKAEYSWLCRNEETVEAYMADPLCGFDLSVEGYEIFFQLLKQTYKRAGWRTEKPELPILFIGGADDPYIIGPAPFHQMLRSMRNLGYRNVKGKLYPGLRHEILNEAEKELVFRDLEKYLEKVLEKEPITEQE